MTEVASFPVFPLPGAILLPRAQLPLHIFEDRYRAMARHALAGDRRIGMIQPRSGAGGKGPPSLFAVGCLGRIVASEELDDGRYNLVLEGVSRFTVVEELTVDTPFRQVSARLHPHDADEPGALPSVLRADLEREGRRYADALGLTVDWDAVARLDDEADRLVGPDARLRLQLDPGIVLVAEVAERIRQLAGDRLERLLGELARVVRGCRGREIHRRGEDHARSCDVRRGRWRSRRGRRWRSRVRMTAASRVRCPTGVGSHHGSPRSPSATLASWTRGRADSGSVRTARRAAISSATSSRRNGSGMAGSLARQRRPSTTMYRPSAVRGGSSVGCGSATG